jgi:hypothetical protein
MKSIYLALLSLVTFVIVLPVRAQQGDQRVFERVLLVSDMDVEQAANALEDGFQGTDWKVIGRNNSGVPESCTYASTVLSVVDPAYANDVMRVNPLTGPYGIVQNLNVFSDEDGVSISVVNPNSILRTVLLDDAQFETLAKAGLDSLKRIISTVPGEEALHAYGQKRKKGYIGRTMGVMAGGSFDGKIETLKEITGRAQQDVTEALVSTLQTPGEKWHMQLRYTLPLPQHGLTILGVSGDAVESRSFEIVKAGSDKPRKKFACPGLAYSGAYPLELVIRQVGPDVRIEMVDAMYRMKMYFEDAGKWAFMKNMGMPGSIAGEIKTAIKKTFE